MSVGLQLATLEDVVVEPQTGLDGQGKPTYGTSSLVKGRVVGETKVIRRGSGSEIETFATIWIAGDQVPLPLQEDRLTLVSGLVGIVVERLEGRRLSNVLNHIRIRLRKE